MTEYLIRSPDGDMTVPDIERDDKGLHYPANDERPAGLMMWSQVEYIEVVEGDVSDAEVGVSE